jgi:hypothetical protein
MDLENLNSNYLEFEIWLKNGYDRGWVSDVFCNTHDTPPMSDEETSSSLSPPAVFEIVVKVDGVT